MEYLPHTLNAVKMGAPMIEPMRDKAKYRIDKARGRVAKEDPGIKDSWAMEDKGYVLKRRSEVASDEEVVEVVRHRGQVLPRRPGARRRTSSMDGRYQRDAGGYGSESEGSVPPRNRRAQSNGGKSRRGGGYDSSSSSSSNLGSSSGSEQEIKKARRKKWITGGFAAVATIHAASKVYSSIENHDKRVIAVQQGTMSPEEAHKQARSARWQDAAAIGIAALGIKGAISEWKEMTEEHEEHKKRCEEHEEHHRKRLEHQRRMRARQQGGYYKGRDGNWYYDGQDMQDSVRSRGARSNSTNDQLAGPRQGERKMIEAPPSRGRNAYNDEDSDSESPVRDKSRKRVSRYHDD